MSEYQAFVVELSGNVAHVQINRPEKINAMNAAFWTEIIDIFQWVEDTDAVRAGDLAIFTADHGNDPTFRGTEHTRERVPVICAEISGAVHQGGSLWNRAHRWRLLGSPHAHHLVEYSPWPASRSG